MVQGRSLGAHQGPKQLKDHYSREKLSCPVTGNVEVVLSSVFLLALLLFISYLKKNDSECHFLSFPDADVPLRTVDGSIKNDDIES